jgi:outer membrane protein OmpA-like peptidoglycan-associated protein
MNRKRFAPTLLIVATAALAACSSVPERNAALEDARNQLAAAQADPQVLALAPDELQRAVDSLRAADRARIDGATLATIDHQAYLTRQRVAIAQDTASSRSAEAVTASAAAERDRTRLAMRTSEADAARQKLASNELAGAREAELARQRLAMAQQSGAATAAALASANAAAQADQQRLAQRDARVGDLEAQLKDLNARKTDRGMVVTLGDVLFASGQAQLQSEGVRSIAKLADFLKRNPQRKVSIEGYTDSVGSADMNQALSERRARAVKDSLVDMGVGAASLSTQAHGEEMPVASNATAAGRQQNRRVEVVFGSDAADLLVK